MNSASRGLRPTVDLRRPESPSSHRRRPTPGASAPSKADFNRHKSLRPTVGLRRPERPSSRRRRPTPGAQRLWRPISIGTEPSAGGLHAEWIRPPVASGRRSACADRKSTLRVGGGRRPARQRLRRPISIGTEPSAGGLHAEW